MAPSGFTIPGNVVGAINQANGILGTAMTLIGIFKATRDAIKKANPQLPDGSLPSDQELIDLLQLESGELSTRAAAIAAKWSQQT